MKVEDMMKVINAIKSMNNAELNLVVGAVNDARRRTSIIASSKFTVGQKVQFGRPNGRQRIGIVEKMNPQKALVNVNGSSWRVPYSLMKGVA